MTHTNTNAFYSSIPPLLLILLFASQAHADLLQYSKDGDLLAKIQEGIEQGTDVNTKTKSGMTPLMWACVHGGLNTVRYLEEQGADIDYEPTHGAALRIAVRKKDIDLVRHLIEQGAYINAKDETGFSPLLYASQGGHIDIVKYLVSKGADIQAKDTLHRTPLIWAATFSHLDVVQYLVTQGADIHTKDIRGRTALDHAHNSKRQNVVNYLKSIQ